MGSRRGPEQTIGQQNFKMKFLLVLCLLGLAAGGQDYKMFTKWAKTKAMESCWGEDNMKLYTVNMKKAVAKCHQVDAPELDLAPFRSAHRFVNNLVRMGGQHGDHMDEMETFMKFYKFTKMMDHSKYDYDSYKQDDTMEKMKMMMMMKRMMHGERNNYEDETGYHPSVTATMFRNFKKSAVPRKSHEYDNEAMSSLWRSMGQMRYKRQADDSLALNDRLKEKLVGMMEEHVNMVSNMTCVLKELNVIDHNNNVDLVALKEDSKQYKMPSQWFGHKYEEILEGCYEVSENLPASLQEEYVPSNYNGPMRNLGKIKSFMNCCKSAKMKLCMNQDTKKKIEANFGPVEELVEGFNNQLTEDQVFFMVNQLLEGSEEDQYM